MPLNVFLNSRLVGRLHRQSSGAVDFRYDASWLEWEHAIPVSLSLLLREDRYIGEPVLAVLENLLPDHEKIRRRIAARLHAEGSDPYSLLAANGRDCVGAASIARMLCELGDAPLGLKPEDEFRISIAGAQEKTALLRWKAKWHQPEGTTPTTHILKPQIGRLLRLPQEDCCQALSVPPSRKYEPDGGPGIARVLDLLEGSDEPDRDRCLFLKAQILFWLLGATDGHAKNFSIFLRPGSRFVLTPLYDVMSAQPALAAGQLRRNQMKTPLRWRSVWIHSGTVHDPRSRCSRSPIQQTNAVSACCSRSPI